MPKFHPRDALEANGAVVTHDQRVSGGPGWLLAFYERLSAKDVAAFVEIGVGTLTIGTAPGEWVTEKSSCGSGWRPTRSHLRAGPHPVGYAEGSLGWAVDEPSFVFANGMVWATRLTAVLHRATERWRVVHMHVSVGVPDEETAALQEGWGVTP